MQLQNKKKWLPWLLAAVMAPFAVGVWLVPYFHSRPGPGMSAAVRPVAPPARPAALPAPSPQKPATSNADAPTERQPLPLPNVPVAGNLGTITDLRAQLQEKQIRQALSEIDAKLAGAVPSSPGVAVLTPDDLARMVAPEHSERDTSAVVPSPSRPTVVSIQGVDGKLSATLRSGGKLVTVRAGQKVAGGTVTAVSRDRVTMRNSRGVEPLTFE